MDDVAEPRQESFAPYLVKVLIAKKGYRRGALPEAQELYQHCSEVLTRANGLTLSIVAIVDRESDPSSQPGLTKETLERIGTACLQYTGRAATRKLPVSITIVEIGQTAISAGERGRLSLLKSGSPFAKVLISAFALDIAAQEIWTNSPLRGCAMRSFLRGVVTKPRLPDAALAPKPHAAMPERRPLLLTYGLLAFLLAVFIAEYVFRLSPASGLFDPSIGTLIALGALKKSLVLQDGEWWRLFSAPLLHAGLIHIAFNGLALFFAGSVLENVIGRAWFAAIFAAAGVSGALASLFLNPESFVSVGASGAVMGLFAAAFVAGYRYPKASPMRTFLQSGSLPVLIFSLIPLFNGLFGQRIDLAAHAGGAICGFLLGGVLVAIWRKDELLPPYRALAWALAAAGLCGALYSGVEIARNYEQYDLSILIPEGRLPKDFKDGEEQSARLVASFPRDPRSHMYRALALMDEGDSAGAEQEWKVALAEGKKLHFNPNLEEFIRTYLAATLKENGKEAEARQTAQPVCAGKGELSDALAQEGLCP